MLEFFWLLLNLVLGVWMVVLFVRAVRLINAKYSCFSAIIFVFGILALISGSKVKQDHKVCLQERKIVADTNIRLSFLNRMNLNILSGGIGEKYSVETDIRGWATFNWRPVVYVVNKVSDGYEYKVRGVKEWKLLTATIFSQSFELVGKINVVSWREQCKDNPDDWLKPLWEIKGEGHKLLVRGYKGDETDNGAQRGEMQADSSMYVSGFEVVACEDSIRSLLGFGEEETFKISRKGRFLYVDWIMNLPVAEGITYKYVPVIRYIISERGGKWEVKGPRIVLDWKALTDTDFFRIKKDLGWDRLYPEMMFTRNEHYPETRLAHAFVVCLRYFPKYNTDFLRLDRGDGAVAELYEQYASILKELENGSNNS